jgi:thiopurine S-methyltransferase
VSQKLDKEYWSNRYKSGETGWDTGSITQPLKDYFDQLSNKDIRILIPGAGNSYEAEYLHNHQFKNVFVCDLSPLPLENLYKRCPSLPKEHLILGNFFDLKDQFDLIVEQTFFCALDRKFRKQYFEKMFSLLKQGGKLVGLLFDDDKLGESGPPYGGNEAEYRTYFEGMFIPEVFEKAHNSIKPRKDRELFIILRKVSSLP